MAAAAWFAAAVAADPPAAASQIRLEELAASASGVGFELRHEPTPRKRMIETMAGGLAVFDYDGDGRADIFFANGADEATMRKTSPAYFNRLYRNEGGLRFADVTREAGIAGAGYSMGAAAADFDNDGDTDLFVVGVFRSTLHRNLGDGTFEDITEASGIAGGEWAVAAGWFDFDGDGLLDLFVVNYADWTLEFDRYCGDRDRGLRVYCHPKYLTPISNRLYRNLGAGRFEDWTERTGLAGSKGRGMSAAFADFNGDGTQDVFVTNDNLPNSLFLNRGGRALEEDALLAGVALLDHGRPVASMGVDIGDFDGDGQLDLSVTALSNETFPLFRGDGAGLFRDATVQSGLARAAHPYAGWGNVFADLDNDGWEDLFTANSHVNDLIEHFEPFVYLQPNTVFRNLDGKFDRADRVGAPRAYRGAAAADFDGDGRLDIVVSAQGEEARVYRNATRNSGNWLAVRLVGTRSSRDAVGAVVRAGERVRWVKSAAGYASSVRRPVHFGLGDAEGQVSVRVAWPSGAEQTVDGIRPNQTITITEPR
ncbi:MAG: CRTAC1 family protein [Bryobacterales bacterium]|nr:CRTAC1 family protein [Bryobacterales bacterium]